MKKNNSSRIGGLAALSLLVISVFAQADSLDEIQVTDNQGKTRDKTNLVTLQNINKNTATDLRSVLKEEPAISFGGGNGLSQWPSIRGMGQDQIDFKVDDTYTDTQTFHHNSRFMIDPSMIQVINVQKGTGSASAGIGATSGAIVARTVNALDLLKDGQSFGFKVNTGISSNKGYWRGASVYGAANGFDALIYGNWNTTKDYKAGSGYQNTLGSNKVINSGLEQRSFLAKIGYSFNSLNRIELSHRQEYWNGYRNLREEFDFTQGSNGANNQPRLREWTQDTTNLEYTGGGFSFIDNIKANVYYSHTKMKDNSEDAARNALRGRVLAINGETKTTGANLGIDTNVSKFLTLKYGVNWRNEKTEPTTRKPTSHPEEKTDTGVYTEALWFFDPFTLTTGLRYDYFDLTTSSGKSYSDGVVNPSVGVIWEATPDLSFKISHNYASRSPRMYEAALAGNYAMKARNGSLKAERSRNTEVGLEYKWNNQISLNATYFWQTIKDLNNMDSSSQEYWNEGTLKNKGYEFGIAYHWHGLKARMGVAYNEPKLNGATLDTVITAIPVGRTWTTALSYQFDRPSIEIGWRGRFVEQSSYASPSRGSGGTVSRPGYGVNDFFINWQPMSNDSLNVNLSINNAFNKYYKSHSQRESTNGNSLPEVGRDIRLGINYTF